MYLLSVSRSTPRTVRYRVLTSRSRCKGSRDCYDVVLYLYTVYTHERRVLGPGQVSHCTEAAVLYAQTNYTYCRLRGSVQLLVARQRICALIIRPVHGRQSISIADALDNEMRHNRSYFHPLLRHASVHDSPPSRLELKTPTLH